MSDECPLQPARLAARIVGACLALGVIVCGTGCGGDAKLRSVHGVVTLDGQPLSTGTVRFVPAAGRAASGKIRSDGTFTLGTYGKSDGALIGTHQVVVIAYEPAGGRTGGRPDMTVANPKIKPLVPERYMAPGTSGLTYEVKPGRNEATIKLFSRKQ